MINKRLTELDGLRGLAAMAVVFFHYFYRYDSIYGHSFNVSKLFWVGQYGVHLFFMISGFVIYWTISRTEKPLDFIWSRFSRLYPVFWAALITTFVIVYLFSLPGREVSFITLLSNFSMIHEYFGFDHVDGVYWSLTLELAFYFWILIIFCLGQIKNIEKILLLWAIVAIAITFYKLDIYFLPQVEKIFLLKFINFFAAGVCFFKYRERSASVWTHLLLITSIFSVYLSYPIATFFGLLVLFALFGMVARGRVKILSNGVLVYLGTISYTLYLIHQNIGYVVINYFYKQSLSPILGISAALIVSLTIAHILLIVIERPSLKFLRKYYKHNDKIQKIGKKLILLSNR